MRRRVQETEAQGQLVHDIIRHDDVHRNSRAAKTGRPGMDPRQFGVGEDRGRVGKAFQRHI